MTTQVQRYHTDPKTVSSPKNHWKLTRVVFDGGVGSWAAAEGTWNGHYCIALRWNGGPAPESPLGSPQSRGLPTWFIVPPGLEPALRLALARFQSAEAPPAGTLKDEILAIGRRCAELPDRDPRKPDEILGYDDSGLPR
ncbi:MAG: type II toxin-antitoxin system VapB family antitoxin [Planctomycetes bacterium]|nr:type II toxin-antitoxin system VapB family antitoxin [Planctomycetota bacterium]